MGEAAKKEARKYTYADYLTWNDDERWELIGGEAHNMSPSPLRIHQKISAELMRQLTTQLFGKTCEVYAAPFEVRLPLEDESESNITNVVQPDITVICDPKKLDRKGCLGAPDFIIEILSPSTHRRDRLQKRNLYEMAGVKEYWLVDPDAQLVEVFRLGDDNVYGRSQGYEDTDTINVSVLDNISVQLNTVLLKPEDL